MDKSFEEISRCLRELIWDVFSYKAKGKNEFKLKLWCYKLYRHPNKFYKKCKQLYKENLMKGWII